VSEPRLQPVGRTALVADDSLAAIVAASFVEIPYQLLTLVFRLESVLRRRIGWGEMERSIEPELPEARTGTY
jgi:hypothetical protein